MTEHDPTEASPHAETIQYLNHCFQPANTAQAEFLFATEKIVAYVGGLGSGKTHIGAFWAITQILQHPQGRGLIAANSYKQLESATLPKIFQLLQSFNIDYHYYSQSKILKLNLGGIPAEIHCRSLTEYQDLRGSEYFWVWLDETRDTREEAFWVVLGRLRQTLTKGDSVFLPKLRITTTPDMLKCRWLYQFLHHSEMMEKLATQGLALREIKASSRQNPHLSSDYIAMLEACYDPELAKQEIEGEWVIIPSGKPVFGSVFRPAMHFDTLAYDPNRPLIIGLDWGFHRPAAVFTQEDKEGHWLILGELLESDKETGEFCEALWQYINLNFPGIRDVEVYCDPAGNQKNSKSRKTDIEIAREYKLMPRCKPSQIADGVAILRRKLSQLLGGQPAIRIDEGACPLLAEGFRGAYHYPEKASPRYPDALNPFKDGKYDHLFDALRYIAINRYQAHPHRFEAPSRWEPESPLYDVIDPLTGY